MLEGHQWSLSSRVLCSDAGGWKRETPWPTFNVGRRGENGSILGWRVHPTNPNAIPPNERWWWGGGGQGTAQSRGSAGTARGRGAGGRGRGAHSASRTARRPPGAAKGAPRRRSFGGGRRMEGERSLERKIEVSNKKQMTGVSEKHTTQECGVHCIHVKSKKVMKRGCSLFYPILQYISTPVWPDQPRNRHAGSARSPPVLRIPLRGRPWSRGPSLGGLGRRQPPIVGQAGSSTEKQPHVSAAWTKRGPRLEHVRQKRFCSPGIAKETTLKRHT